MLPISTGRDPRRAYAVHQARLIGSIADKTGIVPFMDLVAKVMTTQPYVSARTVYWVVDNARGAARRLTLRDQDGSR